MSVMAIVYQVNYILDFVKKKEQNLDVYLIQRLFRQKQRWTGN